MPWGLLGAPWDARNEFFTFVKQIEVQFREDVYKAMRLRIESNFPELRNIPPDPADIRKVASVPQLTTPLLRAGSQDDVCLRAKPKYSAYGLMMHGYILE